ncbi:hypothetical protein [Rhodococcus sp. LB1]|uniref:hypothetical protein n=1 Tax=Rhodococcus sp. LB1 TaxID=1807499 RepID=UPI003FA6E5D3
MRMRATHRVEGHLAVELAPEVFLLEGEDRSQMRGSLAKACSRIEEYDGDDTVEVSDKLAAEAPEWSARWAANSRRITAGMMKYQTGT